MQQLLWSLLCSGIDCSKGREVHTRDLKGRQQPDTGSSEMLESSFASPLT
jgi:hypothetical protein